MTESQLRKKVVKIAVSYLGCKEADGSHRKIIDLYNSHKPLARGYAVKYTDAWCSTFASAVAIAAGMTDIIPTECGCGKHIELFKKLGSWQEDDAYVPKPALAQGLLSRLGQMKHCNHVHFFQSYVEAGLQRKLKCVVREHARKERARWNTSTEQALSAA